MTYYIDPGTTKGCAVAVMNPAGLLIGLGVWSSRDGFVRSWGLMSSWGGTVWEMPQLYPGTNKLGQARVVAQANDLIELAAAGSGCAHALGWGRGGVRSVKPRAWKGQIPKPIPHRRAIDVLTGPELALLAEAYGKDLASLRQYILDACLKVAARAKNIGYSSQIVDLLDAVTIGLVDTGRLAIT